MGLLPTVADLVDLGEATAPGEMEHRAVAQEHASQVLLLEELELRVKDIQEDTQLRMLVMHQLVVEVAAVPVAQV